MASDECVIATYESRWQADAAVDALRQAGFTQVEVSTVSRHRETGDAEVSKMALGDDSLRDAAVGGAVGGAVGAAGVTALVTVTGVGMFLMTGPLVALTGAIVGALLGAMKGWGIHESQLAEYQEQVCEGRTLVIVTGNPARIERAAEVLRETDAVEVNLHATASDDSPEVDDRPPGLKKVL